VLNRFIRRQLPGYVVNDLMHVNRDPSIRFRREILRLDVRIKHLELTLPIVPHGCGSEHTTTLHPVRPIDIGMHQAKRGLNVSLVERRVRGAK
jgi:hypothetical protein